MYLPGGKKVSSVWRQNRFLKIRPRHSLFWHTNVYTGRLRRILQEFHQSSDVAARRRLCSASTSSLVFRRTRLSTIGDPAFPVAASRPWQVMSAPLLTVFMKRLDHPTNSSIVLSLNPCSDRSDFVISDSIIDLFAHLLQRG